MNESEHAPDTLPKTLASDIQLYLDGKIGEEAFDELQSLLESNENARKFYLSYAKMDVSLRETAEETGDEKQLVPMTAEGRSWPTALLQAVAAFILGAAVVYFVIDRSDEVAEIVKIPEPIVDQPAMIEEGLAILTQAVGVEWTGGGRPYSVGSVLPEDTLSFDKGIVQIEFFSGAIVILEGPAKFELVDPMRAFCYFG